MTRTPGERLGQFANLLDDTGQNMAPTVATLAALQAVSTTGLVGDSSKRDMDGRTAAGDGAEGRFVWRSGDQSANVAADEVGSGLGDGGIWTAPSSDLTGASGAWQRHIASGDNAANPFWYGAKLDDLSDDSAALQAALSGKSKVIDLQGRTCRVGTQLTPGVYGQKIRNGVIRVTANISLIDSVDLMYWEDVEISVFDLGASFTTTLVRQQVDGVLQGKTVTRNLQLWANTTSPSSIAYELVCTTGGANNYISYNTFDGISTRGVWETTLSLNAPAGGPFIQANNFTNANWTSAQWVIYPGAASEIHGNNFSGSFQAQTGTSPDTTIEGSFFGPFWDQGGSGATVSPRERSVMTTDAQDGYIALLNDGTKKGERGWSAQTGTTKIQAGYLDDHNGSDQVLFWENENFNRGNRGRKRFIDYCNGKEFDQKITLTNMTGVGSSGHGNGGVVMSAISTSETSSGAWFGLTNTGCTLSKFPTFTAHVKSGNRSGNSASAFENTEHVIGLVDSSSLQNGVYIRREWQGGASVLWDNYLEVVAGGSVIYSQVVNINGTGTKLTTGLDQTDRMSFWVDGDNIYFEMTYEAFNQAQGVESAKRAGINQWSGVMTIPLATAGMFSLAAVEVNPLYISQPVVFDADQLRLRWKRFSLVHTEY